MSEICNIQFWRQRDSGGHFIAWERPEALATDVAEFFDKEGPVSAVLEVQAEQFAKMVRRDKAFSVLGSRD